MSTSSNLLIPAEFFPRNSDENNSSDSDSDSVKYNPPKSQRKTQPPQSQQARFQQVDETFCPVKSHIQGNNFSKNNQVEYRVQIHPNRMEILHEQTIYNIETNLEISDMNAFCMFLQTNKEDSFHREFKLFTQGFISPFYKGNLVVKIKNIEAYTKVLYPSDILGFLTIQPFILKPSI